MSITIEGREVPMTPDCTVLWSQFEVPSFGGHIYLPSANTEDRREIAGLLLASDEALEDSAQAVGSGEWGKVCRVGGWAVKTYLPYLKPNPEGIGSLRANITLGEGLNRRSKPLGGWNLRTPKYLGALIKVDDVAGNYSLGNRWVMSFEDGVSLEDVYVSRTMRGVSVPGRARRERAYTQALLSCGVSRRAKILLDDRRVNTILKFPNSKQADKELVKLDIMAYDNSLDW